MGKKKSNGYVIVEGIREHRRVWVEAYGDLPYGWVVHHINFRRDDNRLENLVALPAWRHDELHGELKRGASYTHSQLMQMSRDLRMTFDRHNKRLQEAVREVKAAAALLESTGIPTNEINEQLGRLMGTAPKKLRSSRGKGAPQRRRHADPYSTVRGKKTQSVFTPPPPPPTPAAPRPPVVFKTAEELYEETFGKPVIGPLDTVYWPKGGT